MKIGLNQSINALHKIGKILLIFCYSKYNWILLELNIALHLSRILPIPQYLTQKKPLLREN